MFKIDQSSNKAAGWTLSFFGWRCPPRKTSFANSVISCCRSAAQRSVCHSYCRRGTLGIFRVLHRIHAISSHCTCHLNGSLVLDPSLDSRLGSTYRHQRQIRGKTGLLVGVPLVARPSVPPASSARQALFAGVIPSLNERLEWPLQYKGSWPSLKELRYH